MFSTMCGLKATYAGLEGPAWGRLPQGNGAEKAEPRKARDEGHGGVFYKIFLVEPLGLPSIKAPSIKKTTVHAFFVYRRELHFEHFYATGFEDGLGFGKVVCFHYNVGSVVAYGKSVDVADVDSLVKDKLCYFCKSAGFVGDADSDYVVDAGRDSL